MRGYGPFRFLLGVLALTGLACNLSRLGALTATPPPAGPAEVPTPIVVVLTPAPLPPDLALQSEPPIAEEQLVINVYRGVAPAVVCVKARDRLGGCSGPGFVLDREGHIVTNNHVFEAAPGLLVALADDRTVPAEVIGIDRGSDLAVLSIDAPPDQLATVGRGESGSLKIGQRAIAIGNPFGLERTLTTCVISSLSRTLPRDDSGFLLAEIMETDAAINPGNSGGPLLNSQGQVISVSTAMRSATGLSPGVGCASPVDIVKRVVPELIASGYYEHTWPGVRGQTISADMVSRPGSAYWDRCADLLCGGGWSR
jgi:S1-C subfamily serine protease